jgi:pyrroloquinoline quinone biosynthesis protein B
VPRAVPRAIAVLPVLLVVFAGCEAREPQPSAASPSTAQMGRETPAAPYVRVLGIAQDGGVPQIGCSDERCEAARRDPSRARRVASLALVLPAEGKLFLVDATPDLAAQLAALSDVTAGRPNRADRDPLDGILLTHAHMGHYLGLALLGFEAVNVRDLPVWCTPRMAAFLRANGPWSQLVEKGNLDLRETPPGVVHELGGGVTAEAFPVPHRDEFSDTVAWKIRGPERILLYVPDVDGWDDWQDSADSAGQGSGLEAAFEGVDVALVDGTFYSDGELPGRDTSKISHPRIVESVERFGPAVAAGELEVAFTHLNHSNPALDEGSEARRSLEAAGFRVAEEGEEIGL